MKRPAACPVLVLAALTGFLGEAVAAQTARLGEVDFPTSGSPEAQAHFIQGVLYLHSFEYGSAAEAFREAQKLEPDFAMAYWGEAMTYNHPVWFQQDREAARAALERLGSTPAERRAKAPTERERGYLEAVEILFGEGEKASRDTAYAEAMRALAERSPDDPEAKAFYALSILGTSHGGRDIPTYMRAAAIAEEVFRDNPNHPGAVHYSIHSYDDPIHAPLGLRAARAYSKIAPDAAHAQHMTTHIFVAMGMWDEVVSQNTIASELTGWRSGHYTLWLGYGYLQQGRYREALEHLEGMREATGRNDGPRPRWHLARMRAHYLIDTRGWESPVTEWRIDVDGVPSENEARTVNDFLEAVDAFFEADRGRAEGILDRITERNEAAGEDGPYDPGRQAARILEMELRALYLLTGEEVEPALEVLRQATAIEDAMPFEFGPPAVVKPSHELFGEILLRLDRPAEAQVEFERALELAPKRARSLLGLARAAAAAGDEDTAATAYRQLEEIWHNADSDVPGLDEAKRFAATGG